jgi:hypothetical protein
VGYSWFQYPASGQDQFGLYRKLLIFFSIRNRRKSDTDQGFDIRESREADTGFCATGSYGEYAAAVL